MTDPSTDAVRLRFAWMLALAILLGLGLRTIFPTADAPWRTTVGVVWHDEGAWVHNAHNKAIYGLWRVDEWNPLFIAPVFTGLEYLSFEMFGVGLRQARLVSELAGLASVVLLGLGVRRIAGDLSGLIAAGLLATNYVYIMYDRAAIMEALMAAFIVASCTVRRARMNGSGGGRPRAYSRCWHISRKRPLHSIQRRWAWRPYGVSLHPGSPALRIGVGSVRLRLDTGRLGCDDRRVALVFVLPHWADYRFYNWTVWSRASRRGTI